MAVNLRPDEQAWLDEYKQALEDNYLELVEDLVLFSREDGNGNMHIPSYTVNAVVVLKEGDRATLKDVQRLGFGSAVLSEAIPFVWVYTREEWERRHQNAVLPYKGDGTSVWSTKP